MGADIDYRKFSNRVCNLREAGFIGIGFAVAVGIVAAILLGIYFGTKCPEGQSPCKDGYTCVANDKFCDGLTDCPIGEDEWECYPSEFYVSFQTNDTYRAGELANNNTAEFIRSKNLFQNAIKAAITNGTEERNVTVFRFRGVDANGLDGKGSNLAVDSLVKLPPVGRITRPLRPGSLNRDQIVELISNRMTLYSASFNVEGANVTTGVGVVLRAPESSSCRIKAVYCSKHCVAPSFYQYGSTKGCPECVCSKVE